MAQYIDKNAVMAEVAKRKHQNILNEGAFEEDIDILFFLDTLEAKEVDLDWKNVRELCVLSAVVELEKGRSLTDQEHYTEVIKRFKAQKG